MKHGDEADILMLLASLVKCSLDAGACAVRADTLKVGSALAGTMNSS